ncbi:MAG: ArsB/NhaD family transporter, partial [Nostocoides sp.]
IFLLLGMMIIVSVIRTTGVFEFLAIWAAKRARGRPFVVMTMLVLITAVASALLDNVTTVLLIAPVTLLVCDRLGLAPEGFLIAEVMASNIGGAATLIGDPPNIIIGSRAGLSFNDFLVHLGPIVLVLLVIYVGLSYLLFGRGLVVDPSRVERLMALDEREAIQNRRLLVYSGVVLLGVLVGFVTHSATHLDPSIVALLGAGAAVAVSRLSPKDYLAEVEWPTLVFFAGLFIMVGGLVESGVIETLGEHLISAVDGRWLMASSGLLWISGVLSGIIDNIPYVATMAPLVQDLVAVSGDAPHTPSLWWTLALGADLGGNMTAVGASANVVVLGIAARNGHPISFWRFTKYGIVVTTVTLLVSWGYVYLRYFALT